MNHTAKRSQNVRQIIANGRAYTLGAVTYYGIEKTATETLGQYEIHAAAPEQATIHMAIEAGKDLLKTGDLLLDDFSKQVRVESAVNNLADSIQILECEVIRA